MVKAQGYGPCFVPSLKQHVVEGTTSLFFSQRAAGTKGLEGSDEEDPGERLNGIWVWPRIQLEHLSEDPLLSSRRPLLDDLFVSFLMVGLWRISEFHMAVGQNQWYHFGVGAPPILVYFSGDWDVHWGITGLLTHPHVFLYADPLEREPELSGQSGGVSTDLVS